MNKQNVSTTGRIAITVSVFVILMVAAVETRAAGSEPADANEGDNHWDPAEKLKLAESGNKWAAYDLWDAYAHGKHGVKPNASQADKWLTVVAQDVSIVRFEPVSPFAPTTPSEFFSRINQYSPCRSGRTNIGAASFFRTKSDGDKLVGSFLSTYPEQLKASLAKVPGVKVTGSEKINPAEFVKYEQAPQESLWSLKQKVKLAEGGNKWAAYDLWDAYAHGKHGVQEDPAEARKWVNDVAENVWVIRFEPTGDFAPTNPGEFLSRINQNSTCRSGKTNIGAASFFRTTKHGDKLVGSFLSVYPDQLKASLAKVPGLKVTSAQRISAEEFINYEKSPQESL